jgi:NTP pyrophosphatase (non-canonical NTP hydrolase)
VTLTDLLDGLRLPSTRCSHGAIIGACDLCWCVHNARLDAAIAAVRAALPVPAWRREPPTVEEVRACAWWWVRLDGKELQVVKLVEKRGAVYVRADENDWLIVDAFPLATAEYAPCLPPGAAGGAAAHVVGAATIRHSPRRYAGAGEARGPAPPAHRQHADDGKGRAMSRLQWRPEVIAFADAMERKLRANDHKPGWKYDSDGALLARLTEESGELRRAVNRLHNEHLKINPEKAAATQRVLDEAADVGNFAMMIADVCCALDTRTPAADVGEAARALVIDRARAFEKAATAYRVFLAASILGGPSALSGPLVDAQSEACEELLRAVRALTPAAPEAGGKETK